MRPFVTGAYAKLAWYVFEVATRFTDAAIGRLVSTENTPTVALTDEPVFARVTCRRLPV